MGNETRFCIDGRWIGPAAPGGTFAVVDPAAEEEVALVAGRKRARRVASRLRTCMVHLNGAPTDGRAPFGGCKQSGNGREWGRFGLEDLLGVKAVMGYRPRDAG